MAENIQKRKRNESDSSSTNGADATSWIAASPPRFISLEELMSAAQGLTNMSLAHEIAVNKDFKLEKQLLPNGSIVKQVHDTVHQAFWDALKTDLEELPPSYDHIMVLFGDLKTMLLSILLAQHTKLRDDINSRFDLELIKQKAEHESLDLRMYADFSLAIMSKMCAPARDSKIQQLQQETDLLLVFRGIFETLELLKLDMANFTIDAMRPHIQQHSIEYEKDKFNQYLQTTRDPLILTEKWLRDAKTGLESSLLTLQHQQQPDDHNNEQPIAKCSNVQLTPNQILSFAYLSLIDFDFDRSKYPETIRLDETRCDEMRLELFKLVLVATTMVIAGNVVGVQVFEQPSFKDHLKKVCFKLIQADTTIQQVIDSIPNIAEQMKKECNEKYKEYKNNNLDQSTQEAFTNQITQLGSEERCINFIRAVLESPSASPMKIPLGLNVVQSELARVTGQLLRIVTHNRAVFFEHYDVILVRLTRSVCESESSTFEN